MVGGRYPEVVREMKIFWGRRYVILAVRLAWTPVERERSPTASEDARKSAFPRSPKDFGGGAMPFRQSVEGTDPFV
jgi:hypothetical protein